MMECKLKISGVVPLREEFRFAEPVDWTILDGERWTIVGPNGAGKSILTDLITGRVLYRHGTVELAGGSVYQDIKKVEFRDIYSLIDCANIYYQKRWNAFDLDEEPFAEEILAGYPTKRVNELLGLFGMEPPAGKRLISLSSGELRKLLIVRTLLSKPKLLILDNPFIGLDAGSRQALSDMLGRMSAIGGLQTVLVMSDPKEIPGWVDRLLPVRDMALLPSVTLAEFKADKALQNKLFIRNALAGGLPVGDAAQTSCEVVIGVRNVSVGYGSQPILSGVDWEVRRGEKWALLGANGSGKSTLLSLVNGDNPQAYANDVTLFDRRRGTGEGIWEIKRRIGYLNADLHSYYLQDIPAVEVVVSGFFDSIGLFRVADDDKYDKARAWLEVFGAGHLAGRSFLKLSYGEQRLVMLARTFVKDPEVLILDEPMHGLDAGKKRLVGRVVEKFCAAPGKTLVYVTHYAEEIPPCVDKVKRL